MEGQEHLFVVGADGFGLRQLTHDGYRNRGPRWSPDGKTLAYTIFGVSTFLLDAGKPRAAQTPHQLPPMKERGQIFNGWSWSPDGRTPPG